MVAGNNFDDDEIFSEDNASILTNVQEELEMKANIHDANKMYGEDPISLSPEDVQQIWGDTCAIKSQQLVLEQYGVDISEEYLRNEAYMNGWYITGSGGGTPIDKVGNLLEAHGVDCHQMTNANVFNLISELAQGHKIIVGVDSGELYGKPMEGLEDLFINKADHALVVAGIDTTDPNNVQVIITDPGTGEPCVKYPLEKFTDAWKDSNCFMVATNEPAPLEHNQEMIGFDYELEHLENIGNMPYEYFANSILPISEALSIGSEHQSLFFDNFYQMIEGESNSFSTDIINAFEKDSDLSEFDLSESFNPFSF